MNKLTISLALCFIVSGCASTNSITAYHKAKSRCGISFLNSARSLEALKCIEKEGQSIEGYRSRAKEIAKLEAKEHEKNLKILAEIKSKIKFINVKYEPPSGIVSSPGHAPPEMINDTIKEFCTGHKRPIFKVTQREVKENYLGSYGSGGSYCTGYGCSGYSSSKPIYNTELLTHFNCLRGTLNQMAEDAKRE
jgi:hypothetical protein